MIGYSYDGPQGTKALLNIDKTQGRVNASLETLGLK